MANCDDTENPSSSTSSKEQDAEKLHSATSLINALQVTADLLNSYVKESGSNFSEPTCSTPTNSVVENFSEPSCSTVHYNSANSLNRFDKISVGQLVRYIVETGALTLEDDNISLSKIDPVPSYWEENSNGQTSDNFDDFCFNIGPESEESIRKYMYNSPSNETLENYCVEANSTSEVATTSENSKEIKISPIIEATVSTMEREILLRKTPEHKKSKLLNLPPETLPDCPNQCESEIMGDDATKNKVNILCECDQPGVAGAAVPVITSFTFPDDSRNESKIPILQNRPNKLSTSLKTDKPVIISEEPKKNIRFKTDSAALLKKEVSKDKSKCIPFKNGEEKRRYIELTYAFSGCVSQLVNEASNLPKIGNANAQSIAIDSIYKYVKSLNKITNELKAIQYKEATDSEQSQDSKSKTIQFEPSKCSAKKGQNCDCHVPTNNKSKLEKAEDIVKDSMESMDGVFIPAFDEPPPLIEDDEEGLGITIKVPENINENGCSHVSVSFADVSVESLKRCPKKYTLHMDFAKRKMVFQSGNNCAMVPDLKVTECTIDDKKSDIVCIMRPNECLFPSQLIPVEGIAGISDSFNLLRSTNSVLLNIVGSPSAHANKRKSLLTKSCTSIRSKNVPRLFSAVDQGPDQSTKSMPQIPGHLNCKRKLQSRTNTSKKNSLLKF